MNCCRKTAKMGAPARHREPARSGEAGGPPGNRAQRRRLRRVQGDGSEAYLDGTPQGSAPEDVRKGGYIRARSK
jgi:hypothetical protein